MSASHCLNSLLLHHSSAARLRRDLSNLTISLYLTSVRQCQLSGSAMKNINHGRAHKGGGRVDASLHRSSCWWAAPPDTVRDHQSQVRASLGKEEIQSPAVKSRIAPAFGKQDTPNPLPPQQSERTPAHCQDSHSTAVPRWELLPSTYHLEFLRIVPTTKKTVTLGCEPLWAPTAQELLVDSQGSRVCTFPLETTTPLLPPQPIGQHGHLPAPCPRDGTA